MRFYLLSPLLLFLPTLATSNPLTPEGKEGEMEEDEPQLQSNTSIKLTSNAALNARGLFGLVDRAYTCSTGYSACAYDSTRCCPSTGRCCGSGYCAEGAEVCCSSGTCREGWNCCGSGNCAPKGGECCSDGFYCRAGKECRVWRGRKVCCLKSGCIGEYDSAETGTVTGTEAATETETTTTRYRSYEYYYTTIYWSYYFYYWTTSTSTTYTIRTITSTRTTTSTIWSVYETDRADAASYLSSRSRSYTFSAPYAATSLISSTDPITLGTADNTGVDGSVPTTLPTTNQAGELFGDGTSSAAEVPAHGVVALVGVVLAGVVGALAFGL
ncbi:hypothetical protein NUU61_008080 [Penicillium alfredii]|uniref:GPI anchored protein n=1 Tax=Penicillium alfredii TaxID=1506179 RepID=A0A9W9JYX5_9EURO|nr:uncharacterized protein NUU61_008080 [Penicillium alfredii]KAJ5086773.1 hypothetical protein NUU61_008080 [Penicillium alfredii]